MFQVEFRDRNGQLSAADRTMVESICADVAGELRTLLPALADVVHVRVTTRGRVIPQLGIGARAGTTRSLTFTVDPSHGSGSAALIRTHLRPALFHECHHMVRGWVRRGGTRRKRFIDGVVHEGLASAFERDAAGHASPWTRYPDEVRDWVDELLPLPVYVPYGKWMFAHPDGRYWVGYRAGVYIADRAMAASGLSAAELAETPCEEVLALAGIALPPIKRWQTIFRRPGRRA